ncbi:MAG: OmpH family outer membrane protein [Candidatus Cloacimonetes bacterium]|nr:OmpH family outer membrane protein [Candidatus Cloacimonadota bacterium]
MKKLLVLATIMVIFTAGMLAQNLKIAYLDTDRIFASSNEAREAHRIFEIDRQNWTSQIDEMEAEILRLEREYETRRLTLTETARREHEERIMTRMRERQQFIERVFGESGLAVARNNELVAPIAAKLRQIIERIAVEESYSFILDRDAVLWGQESFDITEQVVNEMNR